MDTRRQDMTSSVGLLVLRLVMGGYLVTHGWGKLQMMLAGDFDNFADPIGLGSAPSLVLVVVAEVFCSMLVMLGLATRIAAVPVVIAMAVAAIAVHGGDPWTMGGGAALFNAGEADSWASREPALLYLSAFLALIFTGAGKISLDALIWPRNSEPQTQNKAATET